MDLLFKRRVHLIFASLVFSVLSPASADQKAAAAFGIPDSSGAPDHCVLGTEYRLRAVSEAAEFKSMADRHGQEKVLLVSKGEKGNGGIISADFRELGPLLGAMKEATIAMAVKPEPLAPTLYFLQRNFGSRSNVGGVFFNFQSIRGSGENRQGSLRFTIRGDEEAETAYSSSLVEFNEGQWRHVIVTFKEGEVRFYLDGVEVGEPQKLDSKEIRAIDSRASLQVATFEGVVDDVVVLANKALEPSKIVQLFEEGVGGAAVKEMLKKEIE